MIRWLKNLFRREQTQCLYSAPVIVRITGKSGARRIWASDPQQGWMTISRSDHRRGFQIEFDQDFSLSVTQEVTEPLVEVLSLQFEPLVSFRVNDHGRLTRHWVVHLGRYAGCTFDATPADPTARRIT